MQRMVLQVTTVIIAVLAPASIATADVPQMINYQGRLTDTLGYPYDGNATMVFSIWDSCAGGNKLWEETHPTVVVSLGLFNVLLGSFVPIPESVFAQPNSCLDVVANGNQMQQRTQIVSVGYAYHALRSDTAAYAESGGAGGDITAVYAGDGLTDGGESGDVTLNVNFDNNGSADTVSRSDHSHDAVYVNEGQADAISSPMIQDSSIQFSDIGQNGADTGQVMKWNGTTWSAANDSVGGDGGGWVDDGAVVRLETQSDKVGIGTTSPGAKLDVTNSIRVLSSPVSYPPAGKGLELYYDSNLNMGVIKSFDYDAPVFSEEQDIRFWGKVFNLIHRPLSSSDAIIQIESGNGPGAYSTIEFKGMADAKGKIEYDIANDKMLVSTNNSQNLVIDKNGNVGIGTASPQGALDVSSTTGALIVPRMTTAQRDALTPVNGMVIYNTTTNVWNFVENGVWVTK